jgi:PKD repeat protein
MKKNYQSLTLLCLLFIVSINQQIHSQTYATLPFRETFENAWVNKNGTRDVPSAYWKNTPATTDSSWSRDDDGYLRGAWGDTYGSYDSPGANGSLHSARFHSDGAITLTSGKLDLYVNFSNYSDAKTLTFWYVNTGGSDSLKVYLSTDGGTTFGNALVKLGIKDPWAKVSVNLGSSISSTCVIRFKATANNSSTDIGIDEVNITTPTTAITPDFSVNKTTGMAPAYLKFTNLSTPDVTSWSWDFNNDGTVDATTQNPNYTFKAPGTYTVKLTASKTGLSNSVTKTNLITITNSQYASLPFSETFENTWIDRDSVRDVPSLYFSSSPVTGDNSWSRDDDAYRAWFTSSGYYSPAGALASKHSARFHSYFTTDSGTLDAYINFSTQTGNKTLTFYYINTTGTDKLEVFLSTDGGANFGSALSTQGIAANWTKVSVNLGSVSTTTGVIRFKATGDDGFSDIGLDEIYVENPSASQVNANFVANTTNGMAPLTVNFSDVSNGAPTAWSWDFNNDGTVDATTQNPSYTFTNPGVYTVKLTASKTGSTSTQTKTAYIFVGGYASLPYSESFEGQWINRGDIRDVPSVYVKNTPATGDNSWSRNDDGVSRGAWYSSSGSYTPSGANGSSHSASFSSYNSSNIGNLDFYINFSTLTGNKTLTFWCINTDGTDSLKVYLSTNGGTSFGSVLSTQLVNANWTQVSVDLGNVTATNGIIRFKATGDGGNTNIGLDDVSIGTTGVTPVNAKFSASSTSGIAPLTVNFTDQSTGSPTSWNWDFNNDGTVDATTQNPSYTFTNLGSYTVKLTASKTGATDSYISTIFAGGYASLPFNENFENQWIDRDDNRDVPSPYVKNTPATGDNSWSSFDDGSARGAWSNSGGAYTPSGANNSAGSARFHSYYASNSGTLDFYIDFSTATGNKTLSFWYINTDGTDSLVVSLSTNGGSSFGNSVIKETTASTWTLVTVNLGSVTSANGILRFKAYGDYGDSDIGIDDISVFVPVSAQFTSDVTAGVAPFTVNFTDQSVGSPTTWNWDFNNDGTVDATTQNPSYTFSTVGTYTVKLVASKPGSSDTQIKTSYINVVTPISANFTTDVTSGYSPLTVKFTDQSTGSPTAWSWDFNNDGTVDATTQNPSYTFTNAGTYDVKLIASKTGASNTKIMTAYITVTAPPIAAQFSADVTSGSAPLLVHFTDQSTGNPTSWSWDFNDDGIVDATTQNPSLYFPNPGTYTVKLTVANGNLTNTLTKTGYIVVSGPTGVSTVKGQAGILVYPNPSDGNISIDLNQNLNDETILLDIFDKTGKTIVSTKLPNQKSYNLDLSGYPAGIYTIKVIGKTQVFTSKIVIK